jgi:hypothetical protein
VAGEALLGSAHEHEAIHAGRGLVRCRRHGRGYVSPLLAVGSTERVELGAMWTTDGELANPDGWSEVMVAKSASNQFDGVDAWYPSRIHGGAAGGYATNGSSRTEGLMCPVPSLEVVGLGKPQSILRFGQAGRLLFGS